MGESSYVLESDEVHRSYPIDQGFLRPKKLLHALSGVSLKLERGKTIAVVGESGCGKSTLARILTAVEAPSAGRVILKGRDVESFTKRSEKRALRRTIQMVFQDPYGSLNPRKTIGSTLQEPLKVNSSYGYAERRERALVMLKRVGLREEHYVRYPHMFSGGQRQRVSIARALMLEPEVVVMDEPVSALDISIQAQVLNIIRELQSQFHLAYVFISHNLSVVRFVADSVLVMYLGKVVESAPRSLIFDTPQHPYTQALLAATPMANPRRKRDKTSLLEGEIPSPLNMPSGCSFAARCPYARTRCRDEIPTLQEVDGALVSCHGVEEGRVPVGKPVF